MHMDNCFNGSSRREFLKKAGQVAVAIGGLELIASCATTETRKTPETDVSRQPETVSYLPLKGHKVQPPQEGCYVGFRRVYVTGPSSQEQREESRRVRELLSGPRDIGELRDRMESLRSQAPEKVRGRIHDYVDYYENAIGRTPYTLILHETPHICYEFPTPEAEILAKRGVKPFIAAAVGDQEPRSPLLNLKLQDIIAGKYDKYIDEFVEGARQFGEQYGGFFIWTMQEMNGFWMPWSSSPDTFKKAWQHLWERFERKGANQYATWVWSPDAPDISPPQGKTSDNPEWYYPGDEFVDWIGWSAYARASLPWQDRPFKALNEDIYKQMRTSHPQKPLMQTEFGKTKGSDQPRWFKNAFETIKSWPGMKAAIVWDNVNVGLGDDHTLSNESLKTLKEIVKDPYFIMAK